MVIRPYILFRPGVAYLKDLHTGDFGIFWTQDISQAKRFDHKHEAEDFILNQGLNNLDIGTYYSSPDESKSDYEEAYNRAMKGII